MGDAAISLDGISKRYGRRDALKGLTLKVHVAILKEGRLVVSRPLDELKEQEKRIRVSGTPKESDLAAVAGVRRVSREGAGFLLHASGDPGWLEDAVREVSGVTGVQAVDQSLEEIFLSYVEGTAGA